MAAHVPPGESIVSDDAVQKATGRDWDHWFSVLDQAGAHKMAHADIARRLQDDHDVTGWWAQSIAVRYEQARGIRKPGQSSRGDWQVSVQKTLPGDRETVWGVLVSTPFLGGPVDWAEGADFVMARRGIEVTVRAVRPPGSLRFWWRPRGAGRSTVEVTLQEANGGRCALRFSHGGLASEAERETMRAQWRQALDEIRRRL